MAIVTLGLSAVRILGSTTPASANPGTPGVTQPGVPVYSEDFSATSAAGVPIQIGNYVGGAAALNEQYKADAAWSPGAQACNGWILRQGTPVPANLTLLALPQIGVVTNNDQCARNTAFTDLGNMAYAMGIYQGMTVAQAQANQILSEYTNSTSGAQAAGIQLETKTAIPAVAGHFYAVSGIFGETNCLSPAPQAQQKFSILVNGVATVVGQNLNPCTDPSAQVVNGVKIARLQSGAIQVPLTGTPTLGLRVENTQANGAGNDVGFDLPQLVDVTPQLDKSFSPTTMTQGASTTLTYTVTNTSDLAAKNGWHFVDNLPAGLTASGTLGGTCVRTASSVAAGTVDVTGNLAAGSASCTITVTVTSNTPGNYNNSGCVANNGTTIPSCTNNFPTISGINPPGTAPLTVLPVVDLSITKSANLAQYTPGGTITYTVTAHNNGPSDAINAVLTDPLPASITGATWTCTVTALGTANLPPISGPTKCGAASGTGSITDTVRINTGGTIRYTITGTVGIGTTGNVVNKATIIPAATTPIPNMPGGGTNPVPGSTTTVTTVDTNCPPSPGSGCSATVTTPPLPGVWTVAKTAMVNGTAPATNVVQGGDVITYTVKATGVSGLSSNALLTDNLANVLDDATFVAGSATLTVGGGAPVAVPNPVAPGYILTTGKFNLAPGVVATLRYQVTVKANVWNKQLINVVTGSGDTSPTTCAVGVTPVAPVCTTTHLTPAKVLIQKIGESGSATWVPMDGSSWAVFNDNAGQPGTPYTGTAVGAVVPASTGQFQLSNIPVGTYWLTETAAPAGFSLLAEPVQFTIAANGAVSIGQGAGGGVVTAADAAGYGIFTITVRDVPALQLPESGGPGTVAFTAGGSVLILAAAGLLLSQRRRRTDGSEVS
ncbi:SpaA isopeptide-forming pilin-related protein [Arthrobacter alpinus]|uniref:DUF7927 domain-containing protein n=1 Tax=Arthrobacter alpinus TaxID=656366 RepID=UPI0014808C97|nr:SpaA isopeptide-forming pilin-related protein [Arthrobacter alpinus]